MCRSFDEMIQISFSEIDIEVFYVKNWNISSDNLNCRSFNY